MNPFTLVNGKPYPLDMRGELDDTAAFKNFKKYVPNFNDRRFWYRNHAIRYDDFFTPISSHKTRIFAGGVTLNFLCHSEEL